MYNKSNDSITFAKNIYAKTLDDYRKNYNVPANQISTLWMDDPDSLRFKVTIYKNTDITTHSGIKGLKQEYSYCMPEKNSCTESHHYMRYIFMTPKKEIRILINPNRVVTDRVYPFEKLEKAIIDTVDYK